MAIFTFFFAVFIACTFCFQPLKSHLPSNESVCDTAVYNPFLYSINGASYRHFTVVDGITALSGTEQNSDTL